MSSALGTPPSSAPISITTTSTTTTSPAATLSTSKLKYADVGINLTDSTFRGIYHSKRAHEDDLPDVIARAVEAGVSKMMVTGSDLVQSRAAVELARKHPGVCYATVGVHPCSVSAFDKYAATSGGAGGLIGELSALARRGREEGVVVAFGEVGLDYDRLHFAGKESQIRYFEMQLDLAVELQLPLFLHSRAAAEDFERLLRSRLDGLPRRGLVHSFTGETAEMQGLVEMGFDIGVNGCSLKTEGNLDVVRQIPLGRLQLETDGPWCEIRPSHASSVYLKEAPLALPKTVKKEKWQKGLMVKGRNEPCTIARVAHVVAAVKGVPVEDVCEAAWNNSTRMFGLGIQ